MGSDELSAWIKRVSKLALIRISESEERGLLNDLMKIIGFFNVINELDLSNVQPLFMILRDDEVVRDDEVRETLNVDDVMLNVKESEGTFIKGPKTT